VREAPAALRIALTALRRLVRLMGRTHLSKT
jgi:hypothetical protein